MQELSLKEIAEILEGKAEGDINKIIRRAAPFEYASDEDITYANHPKFLKNMDETRAGAIIVPEHFQNVSSDHLKNLILVKNPYAAFAKILKHFHPPSKASYLTAHDTGSINANVCIGRHFKAGENLSTGPFVVIGDNVTIGDRVILHPGAVIGDNVEIGSDTLIYPNVTILERCRIGSRVIIHAGTVIGSDGLGFAPEGEIYHKIPHTGIVQIDDDVEIGAGNTIDRGTFGRTWIQRGVKTDNLVHIAHNVTVGENTLLVAHVGISGSVTIGKHAILAGQAGVAGHLTIGDNVIVGPQSGITKSVPDGEIVSGSPEMPHKLWLRVQRIIPMLPEMKKKLTELEKKISLLLEK